MFSQLFINDSAYIKRFYDQFGKKMFRNGKISETCILGATSILGAMHCNRCLIMFTAICYDQVIGTRLLKSQESFIKPSVLSSVIIPSSATCKPYFSVHSMVFYDYTQITPLVTNLIMFLYPNYPT